MRKIFGFRPNRVSLHTVTHREIGDIPGIIKAPRTSTFVVTSLEDARKETDARADVWCASLLKYVAGEYGGKEGEKDMWRNCALVKPLFGAYGEKL